MKKIRNIFLILSIFTLTMISTYYTVSYLIREASPVYSTFIPDKSPLKDLYITNMIKHNLGTNYEVPEELYFDYEINLTEQYANKDVSTTDGVVHADENGVIKVKVPANSDLHIYQLDAAIEVTIKYLNTMPGFSVENDTVTTIVSESDEVSFIPIYKPLGVKLSQFTVSGDKKLSTRDWIENEIFEFNLEMKKDGEWIVLGTETIKYDSTNPNSTKFDFSKYLDEIVLDNVGEYEFRMSELVDENKEKTDFDNTIKTVNVIVADKDMDGKLEISNVSVSKNINIIKENDTYKLEVKFDNAYSTFDLIYDDSPKDSVLTEDIVVVKNDKYDIETVIEHFDGLTDDYTYKLYDKDGKELNSTLVRTGDYVLINSNNQEYKFYMVLKGDVNGDGDIAPIDYVKIKNHIMEEKIIEDGVYKLAADYNDDDGITPLDYVKVKNHIMNGGK